MSGCNQLRTQHALLTGICCMTLQRRSKRERSCCPRGKEARECPAKGGLLGPLRGPCRGRTVAARTKTWSSPSLARASESALFAASESSYMPHMLTPHSSIDGPICNYGYCKITLLLCCIIDPTCRPEVPTARHGTKPPKLPSMISRAMGINQTPGSNHSISRGLLPQISNSRICGRRSIVESSKRLLKRRQSLSPPQSSDKDVSESQERLLLAPVCSGYATATEGDTCALGSKAPEPLPRTPLHSPPTGRIRKGSLATKKYSNLQVSSVAFYSVISVLPRPAC